MAQRMQKAWKVTRFARLLPKLILLGWGEGWVEACKTLFSVQLQHVGQGALRDTLFLSHHPCWGDLFNAVAACVPPLPLWITPIN